MHNNLITFVIVVGILGVISIVIFAIVSERKRTAAIEQLARDMGFAFIPDGTVFFEQPFALLHLFTQGHSKKIHNVLSGQLEDIEVLLFDYRYTVGSGRSSSTHQLTVAAFRAPDSNLPSFELRPEHLFHKIGQAFGYQDIDMEDYTDFSNRYLLRGQDEQAVRAAFSPQTIHGLEGEKNWCIEASDQWMVIYNHKHIKPEQWPEFLDKTWNLFLSFQQSDQP